MRFLSFIVRLTAGLTHNEYSGIFDRCVQLDDLFAI